MFRVKLSKFRQAFAVAFIPRILVKELGPVKKKFNSYTFDVFNKFGKSTDAGSTDEPTDKQRRIQKWFEENESEKKYDRHEGEIPIEKEIKISISEVKASDSEQPSRPTGEDAAVRATTASLVEETLAQKIEKVEETPHVEACPKNVEGFNSNPKVMGHEIDFFANEKIQQIDLDDLAKRCVGAPIGNIDELLLKEMKNMSLKDVKSELDMNLVKGHCVEKYYSGIFEHLSQRSKALDDKQKTDDDQKADDNQLKDPLHLYLDNRIEPEIRKDRTTPLHTDSVHLFAFDEGTRDFKESGFLRDSCINFTSDVQSTYNNLPEVITPYDGPLMPCYEYVNKERIVFDDVSETIADTAVESGAEANMPVAEDILLREEESGVTGDREMDPLQREPNITHFVREGSGLEEKDYINNVTNKIRKITRKEKARPTVSNSTEPAVGSTIEIKGESFPKINELNLHRSNMAKLSQIEMLKLIYVNPNPKGNKKKESRVYTTPSEYSSDTDPLIPTANSAISGTLSQEMSTNVKEGQPSVELPENSAISANQNPGEYYSVSYPDKPMKSYQPVLTLTAETLSNYSNFYTPLRQNDKSLISDTDTDAIQELGYPTDLRDPFSYACFQKGPHTVLDNLAADQISQVTLDKITISTKIDDLAIDDGIPLSQILKRIRDKNRLQFCRDLLLQCAKPTAKKLTCPPPLDRSKPRTTLYPRPCQPKPKPPEDKPQPCKPKNDPCAKLVPVILSTLIKSDVAINIPLPIPTYVYTGKDMVSDEIVDRLRKLGEKLQFVRLDRNIEMKDANCARDFEPWIPIPSWPVPKVEKRRPFVCPKEGCKQFPVPQLNPPKQPQCPGMPRKRFSFSAINVPEILID